MNPDKQELSRTLANSLYQKCGEGASYNSSFETPKWGYLVTIEMGPSYENAVSVNPQEVAKFIEKYLGRVHHPIFFFTAWKGEKTECVYFDLQEQCANEEYAIELAEEKSQPFIWDVQNNKKISVKS
jgi:hypothetical protein